MLAFPRGILNATGKTFEILGEVSRYIGLPAAAALIADGLMFGTKEAMLNNMGSGVLYTTPRSYLLRLIDPLDVKYQGTLKEEVMASELPAGLIAGTAFVAASVFAPHIAEACYSAAEGLRV